MDSFASLGLIAVEGIAKERGGVEPVDRYGWIYWEIKPEWNEGLKSANGRATPAPMMGK